MLHWYLREGMAEERIARLTADARKAEPARALRFAGRVLIAAGERLGAERRRPHRALRVG